eukprot:52148-Eustigmatos_ZCMA.PRE.1
MTANDPQIVAELLQAGADPTQRSVLGKTAFLMTRVNPAFRKVVDEEESAYTLAKARYISDMKA